MPTPGNKRIFYPAQQASMKNDGEANYRVLHGVQSVSMSTTFNLEQVFALGQAGLYANIEDIPDIEVTLSKVLDGHPLVYHEATIGATSGPTMLNRSNEKCLVALGIFSDTANSATGHPLSEVETSGMFVSSLRYNFPVDGNFTEEVTVQGNEKVWANDPRVVQTSLWTGASSLTFDGQFATDDSPIGSGGVNRRQHLIYAYSASASLDTNGMVADPDATILPPEIYGISNSGTNDEVAGAYNAHVTNISVSADLNREPLFELGRRGPYTRTVTLPIEITCEVTAIATSGDMVSGTTEGILNATNNRCSTAANLTDRTIRIATCEGTRIFLGKKNKLASVNYSGGDAGGGNVELSYSFSTFNDLTVMHSGDPNANGATWWASRSSYLT